MGLDSSKNRELDIRLNRSLNMGLYRRIDIRKNRTRREKRQGLGV